jgi:hypothetical protein
MTNKTKALKRERARLRNSQNPQQIDYLKMGKIRSAKTEFWKIKKRGGVVAKTTPKTETKRTKPVKEKKKKEKEPELEVVEEKPELEVIEDEPEVVEIDEELKELYSDDDDVDEEEVEETSE